MTADRVAWLTVRDQALTLPVQTVRAAVAATVPAWSAAERDVLLLWLCDGSSMRAVEYWPTLPADVARALGRRLAM